MNIRKGFVGFGLLLGLLSPVFSGSAAMAAPRDIEVLKSYVGDWRGRGTLDRGSDAETIVCKLGILDTAPTKVTFDGNCKLAGVPPLSIKGTLAFVTDKNRFEAVMSTNTSFSGVAIGRRRGSTIDFDLKDRDPQTGKDIGVAVGFAFKTDGVYVDLKLTEIETGRSSKVSIPFKK